jgi:signal transduction histidine kinase
LAAGVGAALLALAALGAALAWQTHTQALQAPAAVQANLSALGLSTTGYARYLASFRVIFMSLHLALAFVIVARQRGDGMALFTALMLAVFGALYWPFAPLTEPPGLAIVLSGLRLIANVGLALFLCLFPTGRFVPRWSAVAFGAFTALGLGQTIFPGTALDVARWPRLVGIPVAAGLLLALLAAQVLRYRRASPGIARQQTKWVVYGTACALGAFILIAIPGALDPAPAQAGTLADLATGTGSGLAFLLIPIGLGFAVLRYRLWDVDLLINRTLVYVALSAGLLAVYGLLVGLFGALLPARGWAAIMATGLVAVLFEPVRRRLQRGVNRLLYGERDEPYVVLSRLGQRLEASLEAGTVVATIVGTIREALRLPYVALALSGGAEPAVTAASGQPVAATLRLPLLYQGELVGQLLLAPRAPGETFSLTEQRLLADLARHAGTAVHALRLTADLQRSRERLVSALEEERRRLRRDLHDGLGPRLASQAFKLEAARDAVIARPERAIELLEDMVNKTQSMIAELRQLVYGLRPPALDELGLEAALREHALQTAANGLHVSVLAPAEGLPPLPAAVEVAAYRIAQEALNNVLRHAGARVCTIRLALAGDGAGLRLEVDDDGVGLPAQAHLGVGLNSMRERAGELGGTCQVAARPEGGTHLSAWLPLTPAE